MPQHRIYRMEFSSVYPLYVQKAERKNCTKEEVDQVICWLTGYSRAELQHASLIEGVVCGVRVEDIEDPLIRKVRDLDKLVDELAKGKALDKILRQ